jgi:FAD:protein FMN transferase
MITRKVNRRRAISILAGAATLPFLGSQAQAAAEWKGIALGAEARIILDHPDAERLIPLAVSEIRRLENIFSLYLSNSQLARLNRDGVLDQPAFEMIELLSICARVVEQTRGAFDPTVQLLWTLYAAQASKGEMPPDRQIAQALDLTGWDKLSFSSGRVAFARPGMALTLNGIAQGYIADKVSTLLRQNGVANVLVNTGEISGLGLTPDGRNWPVRLGDKNGQLIELSNSSVATSSPQGTTFDAEGRIGHILDPRTGRPGGMWQQVSVVTRHAAEADALSTGFCLMDRAQIGGAKAEAEVYLL